jgi:hypothetical protein
MYSAIEKFGFNSVTDKEHYAAQVRRGLQQVHILPWTQLYGAMQQYTEMDEAQHGGALFGA